MFDAFTLRDDGYRNIFNSLDYLPMFVPGDWLNGFLYFGYGHFDKSGNEYPGWLDYQTNAGAFYNVESRLIDVSDYIDKLINEGVGYFGGYNFKFYSDSDLLPIVTKLKQDDILYGDAFSSYEPSPANAFDKPNYGKYVFYKGLVQGSDCFDSIQKYLKS